MSATQGIAVTVRNCTPVATHLFPPPFIYLKGMSAQNDAPRAGDHVSGSIRPRAVAIMRQSGHYALCKASALALMVRSCSSTNG